MGVKIIQSTVYVFKVNPVPASRPRVSKYGTYYLPTYRAFKDAMTECIAGNPHGYKRLNGPLNVRVICRVARPRTTVRSSPNGDVDNYAKAVLDSCNGVLWEDDDQILELFASKEFADVGSITVEVTPVKFQGAAKK
jgi:Holliday junction resolvase RusA-like endonuclease